MKTSRKRRIATAIITALIGLGGLAAAGTAATAHATASAPHSFYNG